MCMQCLVQLMKQCKDKPSLACLLLLGNGGLADKRLNSTKMQPDMVSGACHRVRCLERGTAQTETPFTFVTFPL